jgi:hypothetical protein
MAVAIAADSVVSTLETDAARRFVRWDRALWRGLLEGPAAALAEGLKASSPDHEHADAVLTAWMRLACEGIGLGYFVPRGLQADNFFSMAWAELLPNSLPAIEPAHRIAFLAKCWNLGENLEHEPAWLQRVFLVHTRALGTLDDVDRLVADVAGDVLAEPRITLGANPTVTWIYLGAEDRRFLPGKISFVAPTVACVTDRLRDGSDGHPPVTIGLWLRDDPIILGPMGLDARSAPATSGRVGWSAIAARDPRVTTLHSAAGNAWREVAALVSSQYVLVAAGSGTRP